MTELPVRKWTQDYKEFLETLIKPESKVHTQPRAMVVVLCMAALIIVLVCEQRYPRLFCTSCLLTAAAAQLTTPHVHLRVTRIGLTFAGYPVRTMHLGAALGHVSASRWVSSHRFALNVPTYGDVELLAKLFCAQEEAPLVVDYKDFSGDGVHFQIQVVPGRVPDLLAAGAHNKLKLVTRISTGALAQAHVRALFKAHGQHAVCRQQRRRRDGRQDPPVGLCWGSWICEDW